jgi:hypothetical protein
MALLIPGVIGSLIICRSTNSTNCSINPAPYSIFSSLLLDFLHKPFHSSLCEPAPVEEELVLEALIKEDRNIIKDR